MCSVITYGPYGPCCIYFYGYKIVFRALKIENSVMKKCHEENMSDAHQVYIKILEAIGGSVHTTHISS